MSPPGDPHWYRDAVIYQVNVKAFFDGNGDGIGDFIGLTQKLDYLRDLGVDTLWLMPFYPSPLRDDGYDIADYENVHPQCGTLDDFRTMLDAAHRRGLRVITELVVNHTSDAHPWFQTARAAPPGAPERDFYVWSDSDARFAGTRIIFTDTETSNWAWDPVAKAYYWHRFFSHQPDLNYDNPAVLEAVFRTMRFWLDMGVDGFRLDAIPYLVEREGTSNENLPETHAVIRRLRAAIDAHYPNRFLLAEANMWPEDVRGYFGNGDECHMAYHFPLMPRMYMAVAQEDRAPIVDILAQTPAIPDGCQWAIFLRNHDELTLEMVTGRERDAMWRIYAADPRARINLGIRRRLAPLMDNDIDRIKLMNSLLLSMPGSPILYYGDEIGMGDNVLIGDRNGVRTPMQWSAGPNAGFSTAAPDKLLLPPITDPVYGHQARNVEAQAGDAASLLNWTRRMLAVRRSSSAFGRGRRQFLQPGNRKVMAYLAFPPEPHGDPLLCVANLARSAQPVELDLAAWKGRVPVELLGRTPFPAIGEQPYALSLAAHGFYWFRLATDVAEPRWHQAASAAAAVDERPVLVLFDGWASLFRDQVMPWRIGMAEHVRAQFEAETLPRHLAAQPWFRSAQPPRRVALADHAVWQPGEHAWLLLLLAPDAGPPAVRLALQGGDPLAAPARWFQPLALAWDDETPGSAPDTAERGRALAPGGIARVRQQARVGLLADAFFDDAFVRAVVRAIAGRASVPAAGGRLHFQPLHAQPLHAQPIPVQLRRAQSIPEGATLADLAALADAPVTRPAATREHTVVLVGDALQLTAMRQLHPGVHPALAIGRFLAGQAGSPRLAAIAGALTHVAADGTPTTMALLQAQVAQQPQEGDARAWIAAHLDRFLDDRRALSVALPGSGGAASTAPGPVAPPAAGPGVPLADLAQPPGGQPRDGQPPAVPPSPDLHAASLALLRLLGTRTAALHRALAAPSGDANFEPEPMDATDWAADVADALALARATFDRLAAGQAQWPAALRGPARGLLGQRDTLLARIAQAGAGPGPARKSRVHGGFGLAQVLLARDDVVFTGFGSGGLLAFAIGRRKAAPLRDVASMLQSISRARLAALQRLGALAEPGQAARRLARAWEQQARQAFLSAYAEGDAAATAAPVAPVAATPASATRAAPAAAPAGGPAASGAWLWLYEVDAALQQLLDALLHAEALPVPLLALAELLGRSEVPVVPAVPVAPRPAG